MKSEQARSLAASFRYAAQGALYCIHNERNFRIHLVAASYAIALACWLGLSREGWAALLVVVALVLSREMMNTSIEALVDLSVREVHPLAKIAKDTAAGAVLISALASVLVGICLFWQPQKLLALVDFLFVRPWRAAVVAFSVATALWFIFGFPHQKHMPKKNGENKWN